MLGYVPWERKHAFRRRFSLVMGQKSMLWWDVPAMDTFLLHREMYGLSDRELHESIEQPALRRAQSGRFSAKRSRPGCSKMQRRRFPLPKGRSS